MTLARAAADIHRVTRRLLALAAVVAALAAPAAHAGEDPFAKLKADVQKALVHVRAHQDTLAPIVKKLRADWQRGDHAAVTAGLAALQAALSNPVLAADRAAIEADIAALSPKHRAAARAYAKGVLAQLHAAAKRP